MNIATNARSQAVTTLLNGTLSSLKNVVPIHFTTKKPHLQERDFRLTFGVLIGFTGDIKGKLVFSGNLHTFGAIGKQMFGSSLESEMLLSFSGELGNMIAGGLSTNMADKGVCVNITSPTLMHGDTTLSGYKQALKVPIFFDNVGGMDIYLLLD